MLILESINGSPVLIKRIYFYPFSSSVRFVKGLREFDPVSASNLEQWLEKVRQGAGEKVLPVTGEIADYWGRLGIQEPLPVIDALMAATALVHDLTLVTRMSGMLKRQGY